MEDKRPVAVRFLEPRRHRLVQSIQRSPRPRFNQLLHRSNLLFRLSRVDLVHQDSAEAGQQAAVGFGCAVPQARAVDGLGAVEIDFLDADHDHRFGQFVLMFEPCPQRVVCGEQGAAVDAQAFVKARHQCQNADGRVFDEVAQAIQTVVAGAVGDGDGVFVEDDDKSGVVATWRAIETTVTAGSGKDDEGAQLQKALAISIELGLLLVDG